MELRLEVENVKCRGCARSIEKALAGDARITRVVVDPAEGTVLIVAAADVRADAAATTTKSFVSCAIGRLSD